MTHEALIAEARKVIKNIERDGEAGLTLEMLPKVTVRDAVVVYFTSDEHEGKIEVFLERDSGKFITAGLMPPKQKPE